MSQWDANDLVLHDRFSTAESRNALLDELETLVGLPCGHIVYSPTSLLPSLTAVRVRGTSPDERQTLIAVAGEQVREHGRAEGVGPDRLARIFERLVGNSRIEMATDAPRGYGNLGVSILLPRNAWPLSHGAREISRRLAVALLGSVVAASHREFATELVMRRARRDSANFLEIETARGGKYLEDLYHRADATRQGRLLEVTCGETAAAASIYERHNESLVSIQTHSDHEMSHAIPSVLRNELQRTDAGHPVEWDPNADVHRFGNLASLAWSAFDRNQRLRGLVDEVEVLAVPFGEMPGQPTVPRGVVAVAKQRVDGTTAFRANDLALVRSLAGRLSESSTESNWFGVIAQLAKRVSDVGSTPRLDAPLQPGASASLSRRRDALFAAPLVRQILDDLVSTTGALCATCRVVVGTGPQLGARTLARLAYAGEDSTLAPPDLPLATPPTNSVNAWVAFHGEPCYLRDLAMDGALSRDLAIFEGLSGSLLFRPTTRSELCVPVFAEKRLVGTINIESANVNGFDGSAHAVDEFAQLVGLAFVLARREVSVEMLAAAEGFLDRRHRLEGEIQEALNTLSATESAWPPERSRAILALTRARALLQSHGSFTNESGRPTVQVRSLVETECATIARFSGTDLSLATLLLDDGIGSGAEAVLDRFCLAEHEASIRFALRQVLSNAVEYGLKDGAYGHKRVRLWRADVALGLRTIHVGGLENVVLGFGNAAIDVNPDTVSQLFREPLELANGRVALGAYLAGEALRRIGGAASFRFGDRLNDATTVVVAELAIPLAPHGVSTGRR